MSLDMAKCPLGSKFPRVENHWPTGYVRRAGESWSAVKTPAARSYPSSPQPPWGCDWLLRNPERLHGGVFCFHWLRSLLIAFALDEMCGGIHCSVLRGAGGVLFQHISFLNFDSQCALVKSSSGKDSVLPKVVGWDKQWVSDVNSINKYFSEFSFKGVDFQDSDDFQEVCRQDVNS